MYGDRQSFPDHLKDNNLIFFSLYAMQTKINSINRIRFTAKNWNLIERKIHTVYDYKITYRIIIICSFLFINILIPTLNRFLLKFSLNKNYVLFCFNNLWTQKTFLVVYLWHFPFRFTRHLFSVDIIIVYIRTASSFSLHIVSIDWLPFILPIKR